MRQALFRAALVTVLVAAAWPFQPVMADDNLEYAVKAAYLVKFIPFIEWPDNAFVPGAPLTICILGGDPFGAVLDKAAAGQRLGDHALEVRRLPVMDPAQACQILFTADGQTAIEMVDAVKTKPVVTITDSGMRAHGIISFLVADNHVRFDIDDAAAQQAGLAISSKLLDLAHAVRRRSGAP
jgi:hypothetical protein